MKAEYRRCGVPVSEFMGCGSVLPFARLVKGGGGGGRVRGIHPMNHASYRWRIPSFPHLMHPQAIIGQIISVLSRRLFNKTKEF